jgi:hypothetical protein
VKSYIEKAIQKESKNFKLSTDFLANFLFY